MSRFLRWSSVLAVAVGVLFGSSHTVGVLFGSSRTSAQEKDSPGKLQQLKFDKERLDYLLYLPEGYGKEHKKWPLVLFLHGRGEKIEQLKQAGLPRQVEQKKDFPFIMVTPESPGQGWDVQNVNALLDEVVAKHKVDKDRIYVMGVSMGGFGAWALAAVYPDKFAAIIPICGGGNPGDAKKIKHLSIWVFHGAKDTTVPASRSEAMVKALKDAGAEHVKFTLYPDAGHDAWTETYRNPEVWEWLLKQKRSGSKNE